MKNKAIIFAIILTASFSLNFVSAQTFSLSEFFYSIEPSTMILGISFLIFFALINFSLRKMFKDNPAVAAIVALSISLLIIYGINLSGFDYENIIYGIGISEELIYTIFLIAAPIWGIFMLFKYGLGYLLISIGALFGIASYFAYEKTILIVAATAFIITGIILVIKKIKGKMKAIPIKLR